jgi:polar amino acid transport system substrate-binding protein
MKRFPTIARALIGAALSLLVCGSLATAQTIEEIQRRGKVIIGLDQTIPPYGSTDREMKPQGYDVDMAQAIAKYLNVQLELVQVAGPTRIPALVTNRVDMVVATLGISPERALQAWFSIPYGSVGVVFVGAKDKRIASAADATGLRVGVVRGGIQDTAFTPIAPQGTTIVRFDDDATVGQALLAGQIDSLVTASHWAGEFIQRNPARNLEVKFTVRQSPYGIGVRRGSADLLQWLNTLVYFMRLNGELDAIHRKWINAPLPELGAF